MNQSYQIYRNLWYANYNKCFFDSSLCGLGRGAGNCDTLQILLDEGTLTKELYDFAKKYIEPLKPKNNPMLAYQYTGNNNIHPNYVVKMQEKGMGEFEIIEKLKEINTGKNDLTSFDESYIND